MTNEPGTGPDLIGDDDRDGPEGWAAPVPDEVDLVVECEAMMSVLAAQRFVRIDAMRRAALTDAQRYGYQLTDVIDRSVRLELATALAITEAAAGALIAQAEAMVHRYPAVLDSLGGARMTQRHATDLVAAIDEVEPELRGDLLPRAVALAESLAVGTFRRQLRRFIESLRSLTASERHERAVETRRVAVQHGDNGMAWFSAYIPGVEANAIYGRLTDSHRAGARALRRGGRMDAGAHAPRNRNRPLSGSRTLPTAGGTSQVGAMACRDLHGARLQPSCLAM